AHERGKAISGRRGHLGLRPLPRRLLALARGRHRYFSGAMPGAWSSPATACAAPPSPGAPVMAAPTSSGALDVNATRGTVSSTSAATSAVTPQISHTV